MIAMPTGTTLSGGARIYKQARTHSERRIVRRFLLWWRRGESNPCPKSLPHKHLRAQFLIENVGEVPHRNKLPPPIPVRFPQSYRTSLLGILLIGACPKPQESFRETLADQAAKAKSRFAFIFSHRFMGLMESQLASYDTGTPVETGTSPSVMLILQNPPKLVKALPLLPETDHARMARRPYSPQTARRRAQPGALLLPPYKPLYRPPQGPRPTP